MNRKRMLEVMKASLKWMEIAEIMIDLEWGLCRTRAEFEEQDTWPEEIKDMRVAVQALEKGHE